MQEWNRAIEMIEQNLGEPVDAREVARVAMTSEYLAATVRLAESREEAE